jgi:hypothetical protein
MREAITNGRFGEFQATIKNQWLQGDLPAR